MSVGVVCFCLLQSVNSLQSGIRVENGSCHTHQDQEKRVREDVQVSVYSHVNMSQ